MAVMKRGNEHRNRHVHRENNVKGTQKEHNVNIKDHNDMSLSQGMSRQESHRTEPS